MTISEEIITIALCALASLLSRSLPFIFISENRPIPPIVTYLGNALPLAIFGVLVIYSLKGVDILSDTHGVPELVAILITTLIHIKYRQMLLSILGGTAVYMLIVQVLLAA